MKGFLFLFLIFAFLFLPVFTLAQERVDINTATIEELQEITGIGPVYAQRIIDNRPFSSLDDLLRVSGIGEKTLQKIKDQGLAFIDKNTPDEPENKAEVGPRPSEEFAESGTPQTSEAMPPNISYPDGIIISKIMPSPEGPDAENEWIEIKNNNDFEVDLKDWIIRDKKGSVKEYILTQKISPLKTLKITRPESKITLNNSGDGLELLNPNKKIIDSVDFGKAQTGIAYIKTSNGWKWDIPMSNKETSKTVSRDNLYENENKEKISPKEETIIDLTQGNKSSGISLFITAMLIAAISAIAFIIVKNKLEDF